MKKAFNFRSAIVCVLVLIMCLTAFVACDKDKDGQDDLSGLGKAKDYVKQLYINNNEETAADYTVVSKVNIAGTIYNVSWTVAITTEGADADSVKVVADESNVTIDVIDMAESEIKYVLTATITDAKGNTETVSFNRKVPKFHVATWAEYAEAKDGKLLVVDGIVTMFTSKGNNDKNNTMYLQDADGAYYAYSMDEDPKDKNIAVGMKVRLTGTKKNYNGTYELEKVLIKEVLDTNVQEVAPININELLANATSVKDKKLTNLQGSIVTLTDAILVEVDDSQKYCYFTVGGIKTYIRPSASAGFLSSKEITAFMKAFKEKIGYTATITGQALVYNNAFYMQPISKDAVEYGAVANLTPAEQVKFVKDNANALSNVTYSGYTVTLPDASDIFTDVKIAWTVDNTEICKIENGVATFTYDDTKEGGKVKLTATYTHATDTTVAPLQNEYTLELLAPQEATVEQFLTKDEDGKVYIITGYIVADGSSSGNGSFVVADATGAVFSYNEAEVELGDKVKVFGTRSSSNGVPQIGTLNVVKLDKAEGESYTYPTPEVIDGTTFDLSTLTKTSIVDYTGKYTKVTGLTFYKDGTYNSAGLLKEGKTAGSTAKDDYTQVLSLYTASDAIPDEWAGKPIVVYGYVRGFSANKYLTIQVTKVEIGYDDATKVAQAKAALTLDVTSTGANFTLPTTGINGTTITWTSSNTAVVSIEGGNATVDNTTITEDTVVTLTATIKLNETADTKTFAVTITKEIKNYTVTIVAPTEGGTLVVKANTEDVVSGASLTENTVLTFVAEPAKGYKLVAIKVNGVAVSETTLALTENVEVTAEFKLLPTSKVEGAEIKSFAELKALLDGGDTTNMYYTMGYIKTVSNATYGNATIEDFDGNTFEIYGMYDFTGATRYDSLATKPVAGDFVVLYGKLALFNTTYEMKDARIAQLNDTVYAPTFAARVEEAKNALTLEAEYGKNFDLVATGLNGTTITWISSNTGLVSIAETAVDGKYLATVTVPDVDTTVTLTATITLGTAQDTKEISVKIKANTKVALTYGTSENGTFEVKANGAVVESGAQLDAFTTVTVTVTPAEGYQLASYTLGEGDAVTTVAGQTSFTFDITATTTLSVAFDRVQSAVATLTFPDANSANNNTASSYTGTWAAKTSDGVEFTVTNFNNNKWGNGWTYIRCGSKKGASVASIATKAVMADVITKVVVTIDTVTASVVNSIKLVVASDAEFANIVETVDVDSIAAGEKTFNVSADKRAANLYYKLVVDCNKASSNGPVQISKIVFWA